MGGERKEKRRWFKREEGGPWPVFRAEGVGKGKEAG